MCSSRAANVSNMSSQHAHLRGCSRGKTSDVIESMLTRLVCAETCDVDCDVVLASVLVFSCATSEVCGDD